MFLELWRVEVPQMYIIQPCVEMPAHWGKILNRYVYIAVFITQEY